MSAPGQIVDPDAPFTLSSLIGEAGVGSNGEKLVNALVHHYPPELRAATLKRQNERLLASVDRDDLLAGAAKIAGVPEVLDASIRGGERSDADAVVTYAFEDERGDIVKGCFPYEDLGKASSDGHVSQRDSLAGSSAARDHATAQAAARANQPESSEQSAGGSGDPIADYEELKAPEVIAYLEAHPERADVVKALERATRGGDARKTVLEWEPKKPEGDGSDPNPADGDGDGTSGDGNTS